MRYVLEELLGYSAPIFPLSEYVAPVFGTAVFLYGGLVFIRGAVHELKDRQGRRHGRGGGGRRRGAGP